MHPIGSVRHASIKSQFTAAAFLYQELHLRPRSPFSFSPPVAVFPRSLKIGISFISVLYPSSEGYSPINDIYTHVGMSSILAARIFREMPGTYLAYRNLLFSPPTFHSSPPPPPLRHAEHPSWASTHPTPFPFAVLPFSPSEQFRTYRRVY